jgi:hypothetical protein
MPLPTLVGSAEAAKILEIGPTNFSHLRKKMIDAGDTNFPEPIARLQCGPIWQEKDMLKFKKHYDSRRRRVRSNGDAPVAEQLPAEAPKATKARTPRNKATAAPEATVTEIKSKPAKRLALKAGA